MYFPRLNIYPKNSIIIGELSKFKKKYFLICGKFKIILLHKLLEEKEQNGGVV